MDNPRRVLAVVAAAAVTLTLAACTGDDDPTAKRTSSPAGPAKLVRAWSVSPGELWRHQFDKSMPWAWTTATSVVFPHERELVSYSTSNGKLQWRLPLSKPLCAIVTRPNDDGIAAVLTGKAGEFDGCATASAVDTRTGKVTWTQSLAGLSHYGLQEVEVGPKALVASNGCDTAVSYDITTGKRIATFPGAGVKDENGCLSHFASDGTTVVVGSRHTDESFAAWDAATGRKLWTHRLHGDRVNPGAAADVKEVYSTDPLVVSATADDHTFLRTFDSRGRQRLVGRELSSLDAAPFVRTVGTGTVVQYGSGVFYDFDVATGRTLHRTLLNDGETAIGVRGDRVITMAATGSPLAKLPLVIRSIDPATGRAELLGVGRLDGVAALLGQGLGYSDAVSGDTLLLHTDKAVTAYRLPRSGTPATAAAATPAPGEFTSAAAFDLCTGVTTVTKRALGFVYPDLPAPAGCAWHEEVARLTFDYVTVAATAYPAGKSRSGTAQAHARAMTLIAADEVNELPRLTPLAGLGDEAWTAGRTSDHSALVRIVVRKANVVIRIDYLSNPHRKASVLPKVQRDARLVAADALAELARRR